MYLYSLPPVAAGLELAYTSVTTLTTTLTPLAGSASAAIAVVCLTIAVRLLLLPLSYAQVRGERDRARLAPKLRELQRRYGKNRERLLAKTQELYAKERVSPLAGCLPMLVQAPVFMTLYGLFVTATIAGGPNTLLDASLAGVSLGSNLVGTAASGGGARLLVFAVLMCVLALTAWGSRRLLTQPALAASGQDQPPGVARALSMLPFLTVGIAAIVPLAAGLYLATTTAWTLAERLALRHILFP